MEKHAVLVNYNFSPQDWWLEAGYKPENVTVYDRSDDGVERIFAAKTIKTPNFGNVDYDKLSWIVENYNNLPDVFLWGKTNLFKYISKEEFDLVKDNQHFTPLLTKNHKTYSDKHGVVNKYHGDMYYERNDSWYVGCWPTMHCRHFGDFAQMFQLPHPPYLPFAPGGNYILTKEVVHRYAVDHYDLMRSILPYAQTPAEAAMTERAYYLMWGKQI